VADHLYSHFGPAAAEYDRGRPGYAPEAVHHTVDVLRIGPSSRLLDLAAGTGKLTRLLQPSGAEMVAVEPVAGMRERLVSALPGVRALEGHAESLPLEDGSVDAAVVGQAFHWFDPLPALAELHRAMVPGGGLALIWNRWERGGWVDDVYEVIEPLRGDAPSWVTGGGREAFVDNPHFGPLTEARFSHVQSGDRDSVVARVTSISFIAALEKDQRADVVRRINAILDSHPGTRDEESIEQRYTTHVYTCARKP
jgi:SAM-dependent methyltransferase